MKKNIVFLTMALGCNVYADNPCGVACTNSIATQTATTNPGTAGATGDAGADAAGPAGVGGCTGSSGECKVFKTTATMTGDLDTNNATIDAICGLPNAAALTAIALANCICIQEGMKFSNGSWRAFISANGVTAQTNIAYNAANTYVRASAPSTVITTFNTLLSGTLSGTSVDGTNTQIWTGTASDGTAAANNCTNWTSNGAGVSGNFGLANSTSTTWITDGGVGDTCNQTKPIYCFEAQI